MLVKRQLDLEQKLDEATQLMRMAVAGQADFIDRAVAWLSDAARTDTFPTHVRSALAREATLAATSLKGYRDPSVPANLPGRRGMQASLALCVTRAEMVLQEELRVVRQRLTDARDKIVQLLAVSSKHLVIDLEHGAPMAVQAMQLWRTLSSNGAETKAMVTYINFSISSKDRLHLLEEIIAQAIEISAAAAASTAAQGGR